MIKKISKLVFFINTFIHIIRANIQLLMDTMPNNKNPGNLHNVFVLKYRINFK